MEKVLVALTDYVEIEVEFPVYRKINEYALVRFDNKDKIGIRVCDYPYEYSGSQISIGGQPQEWLFCPPATKVEFEALLNQVQSKINSLI